LGLRFNRPDGTFVLSYEVIAKVRNLPFDKLRVNGLRLKSLTFSVRGELVEPQKNTFAIGSYLYPAMNRRAIVTDALPAPRLSACAKALADRRQAGLERGIHADL
jgi:hypothetical protein